MKVNLCDGVNSFGKHYFKRSKMYRRQYKCVYCDQTWDYIFTELKEVVTDPKKFLCWDDIGWGIYKLRVGTRA